MRVGARHSEDIMGRGHFTRSLLIVSILAPAAAGAQFLVVMRSASGQWTLTEADEIQINGKSKARPTTVPSAHADWGASRPLGRLPAEPLANFTAIVRSADGRLHSRSADGNSWTLLLPDGSNAKAAESAAGLWKAAAITMK